MELVVEDVVARAPTDSLSWLLPSGDDDPMALTSLTSEDVNSMAKRLMAWLPMEMDVDGMEKKLKEGTKLQDVVEQELWKKTRSTMDRWLPMGKKLMMDQYSKLQERGGPAAEVVKKSLDAAKETKKRILGALEEVKKYSSPLGKKLSSPTGLGFWTVEKTDCGFFASLKLLTTQLRNMRYNFDKTVERFLMCISKKGLFGIPSPFMNTYVSKAYLQPWVAAPMEAILGAYKHFGNSDGCEQLPQEQADVCNLVMMVKSVETQMLAFYDAVSLPVIDNYCVLLDASVVVKFPRMSEVNLFMRGSGGKRAGKKVSTFSFGIRTVQDIFGKDEKEEKEGKYLRSGIGIGYLHKPPQDDVFHTTSSFALSGNLKSLGLPGGLGDLTLDILPQHDKPNGVMVSLAAGTGLLQRQGAATTSVQDAVDQIEGDEEKVLGAVVALAEALAPMDIAAHIAEAYPEPSALLQHAANAAKNVKGAEEYMKESVQSMVDYHFCLSCQR